MQGLILVRNALAKVDLLDASSRVASRDLQLTTLPFPVYIALREF